MIKAFSRRSRSLRTVAVATIVGSSALVVLATPASAAGAATHYAVTGPSTATVGVPINVTVTPEDSTDGTPSIYIGTAHFTSDDSKAVLPADSAFIVNTDAVVSVTFNTPGLHHITATDTTTSSITGTLDVSVADVATHFDVTLPSTATTGTPVQATVTAQDAADATVTSDDDTVHFTSSDAAAVLPADTALVNGVATVDVTFNTTGSQNLTATDTTASTTGSATSTVSDAPATSLSVVLPAHATVGTPVNATITALTAAAHTATGYTGTVRFSSTDAAAVLPGGTTLTNGVGTVSVTFNTIGTETLTATDTVMSSITGSDGIDVVAVPKDATTTTVSTSPTSLTATVSSTYPGKPSGQVTFTDNGVAVGTVALGTDQTATLSHTFTTGSHRVVATYAGDVTFAGSHGSYQVTPPTITAKLTSAHAKTKYHWYRSPVTVSFTCKPGSVAVTCPSKAVVKRQGKGVVLTETLAASDGGRRSVTVHLNIDTTKPSVRVTGVKSGSAYSFSPQLTCVATDALSGVASCTITTHKHGHKVSFRAVAKDKAGNTSVRKGYYTLTT